MSYYRWSGYPYPSECSFSQEERKIVRDCCWNCFSPIVSAWNCAISTISNAHEAIYQWLIEPPETKVKPEEHMLQEFT